MELVKKEPLPLNDVSTHITSNTSGIERLRLETGRARIKQPRTFNAHK
jgi:hypothetical protein